MTLDIYRGNSFLKKLNTKNTKITRSLTGVFFIEFEALDKEIIIGDKVVISITSTKNLSFIISENNKRSYKAYHKSYSLRDFLLFNLTGEPSFGLINLRACIELINSKLTEKSTGFQINTSFNIDDAKFSKDIEFNDDNLLSAVQKICDTYKLEMNVDDENIYFAEKIGTGDSNNPVMVIDGGLNTKDGITKNINRDEIVTRLYPRASADNLPDKYPYKELRPVSFDVTAGTLAANQMLYIEDTTAITKYGVKEKPVEFPDIKIKSLRVSSIDSWNYSDSKCTIKILKSKLPANFDDTYGTTLLSKTSLIIEKSLKSIKDVRILSWNNDGTYINFVYSSTQNEIDVSTWNMSGGSLTLFGYIRQENYDTAKNNLIGEALKYLNDRKEPKVEYTIGQTYIKENLNLSNTPVNIGDTVRIVDRDENIDACVRILEYIIDCETGTFSSLKLSNTVEKMPYDIVKEQIETKQKLETQKQNISSIERVSRAVLERHELLVKANFYGSEKEYARIGAADRNYVVSGLIITPDDGEKGKITWTQSNFQLVGSDPVYTISNGSQTLTTGLYIVHFKISKTNLTGEIVILSSKKSGDDSGYTYYPFGVIEVSSAKPSIVACSYGFTLIDGNFIKTGTVQADSIRVGSDADTRVKLVETKAQEAKDAANSALSALSDIASDSKLTADEKNRIATEWNLITNEKASIESIADKYGLNTLKTTYTNAYNALNTYLNDAANGILVKPLPVDIDKATFNNKFKDYYNAKLAIIGADLGSYSGNLGSNNVVIDANGINIKAGTLGNNYTKVDSKGISILSGTDEKIRLGLDDYGKALMLLGTESDSNFIKYSEKDSKVIMRADLLVGKGKNKIIFEDSLIETKDLNVKDKFGNDIIKCKGDTISYDSTTNVFQYFQKLIKSDRVIYGNVTDIQNKDVFTGGDGFGIPFCKKELIHVRNTGPNLVGFENIFFGTYDGNQRFKGVIQVYSTAQQSNRWFGAYKQTVYDVGDFDMLVFPSSANDPDSSLPDGTLWWKLGNLMAKSNGNPKTFAYAENVPQIFSGTNIPENTLGKDGDTYLHSYTHLEEGNTLTYHGIYVKCNGVWINTGFTDN